MTITALKKDDLATRPAIFVDRDGVVIELIDYLNRVDQVVLAPGVAGAIRAINKSGIPIVIVTNQSAIARGLLSEPGLVQIHARMKDLLAASGARVDGIYYCPHHPEMGGIYRQECECRKPNPGMLKQAATDLALDLGRSVMIGDSATDIEAGHRGGVKRTILVLAGHGRKAVDTLHRKSLRPSEVFPDASSALYSALALTSGLS